LRVTAGCGSCLARGSGVPKVLLTRDDNDAFYPIPQVGDQREPEAHTEPAY
jgi:hypothetical protein